MNAEGSPRTANRKGMPPSWGRLDRSSEQSAEFRRLGHSRGIGSILLKCRVGSFSCRVLEPAPEDQGYLGMSVQRVQPGEGSEDGLLVTAVHPGGAAEKAGLRDGDVITGVDEHSLGDEFEPIQTLALRLPGQKVRLSLSRGGHEFHCDLTLGSRAES